ncbi:hypothetical protein ALPO108162_13650 [Alicyclobacillus pomorum]
MLGQSTTIQTLVILLHVNFLCVTLVYIMCRTLVSIADTGAMCFGSENHSSHRKDTDDLGADWEAGENA